MSKESTTDPAPGLRLAALHRRLGARLEAPEGFEVAIDYGSWSEEYRALREGCGLFDRSWGDRLEMSGADRARFLNGRVTCDVAPLEPGASTYGFVTSAKGRILADLHVRALEERFWLELPPGLGPEVQAGFEKYVLADRVEMAPLDSRLPLALAGPRAAELLAAAELPDAATPPSEPGKHAAARLLGFEARIVREQDLGVPVWTLWVGAEEAAGFVEALLEAGRAAGLRPAGWRAWEALRVEAGRPRFGADFGPDCFPQETGLGDAVSYTKGCYLGQEVVARIHYRGGVNRHLRRLRFSEDAGPRHGLALLHDGREAGEVGSAVDSPAAGGWIGLAIVHQRAAAEGTELEVEGGGTATVALVT